MTAAETLDMLVVGGGPAGTAAAFRAKELGREPLVVDYDDLMKRIRDYSKDKLILPDFGGGDRLCFPKGGDLVADLRFPPIDKDEMCAGWKARYADHGVRHEVKTHHPLHITMRVRQGIPKLRCARFVRAFRRTLAECCDRGDFRVVHYSIQHNHIHCIVEAEDKLALANGMKSLAARVGRAVNRVFSRCGPVLDGRFHSQVLKSPKQVRNALAYVLLNLRKHHFEHAGRKLPVAVDRASSGAWFDGWGRRFKPRPPDWARDVASAETWLLRLGWRRHALIDPAEVPGG